MIATMSLTRKRKRTGVSLNLGTKSPQSSGTVQAEVGPNAGMGTAGATTDSVVDEGNYRPRIVRFRERLILKDESRRDIKVGGVDEQIAKAVSGLAVDR